MKIIHELLKDCEQHNLHEHKETLLNIVESVMYLDAVPSKARGQVDDLWAEVDTIFSQNPWQGEGAGGPRQLMAFMVCYNIDGFRSFIKETRLLEQFKLKSTRCRLIENDDEALLKFGFDWLKHVLAGTGPLKRKR